MAAARRDIAPFLQRVRAFLLGVSSWQIVLDFKITSSVIRYVSLDLFFSFFII